MFEGHETAFPSSNRYKPIRYCCVKYASEALLILGFPELLEKGQSINSYSDACEGCRHAEVPKVLQRIQRVAAGLQRRTGMILGAPCQSTVMLAYSS